MRRLSAVVVLTALLLSGCATEEAIDREVDAQKERVQRQVETVRRVVTDPVGAADDAVAREIEQRGADGIAP